MNNRDDDKGDYNSRIAEMMKHRFLGGGPVEPPDVDAADQRIIMLHGEKARGASTYEMGRGSELMDYGLTWVGWLEKYSQYDKGEGEREGEGTPIFQQTLSDELTYRDYQDKKLAEVKQLGVDGWANEFEDDGEGF